MQKWNHLLTVLAVLILFVAGFWIVLKVLGAFPHTLLLFALGGLVAYALDPVVEGLRKIVNRGSKSILTRELSVTVVMLGLLTIIVSSVWLIGGKAVRQVKLAQSDAPVYRARAEVFAEQTDVKLEQAGIHFRLASVFENPPPDVVAAESDVSRQVLPFLEHAIKDIGESIIVLLIAMYFLIYGGSVRTSINKSFDPDLANRAVLWQTDVNRILGGFVRGQLIIAVVIGTASALFCLAIGLKFWLLIGVFVTMAALIPVFGPYIGAIPAIGSALLGSTRFGNHISSTIAIVVFFIVINEVGSKILYPRLVGAALGLHALLVLFVLFAGLEIGGIVGVLFAAPLTALAWVTLTHVYRLWQNLPDSLITSELVPAQKARRKNATN